MRRDKNDSAGVDVAIAGIERQLATPIFCLPARTEADEITALMLAQVLEEEGRTAQCLPASTSPIAMVESVAQCGHGLICIAATPPNAVMHSRTLARQLYERVPGMHLMVGLWDEQRDLSKSKERIGCNAIVVENMADAIAQIRLLQANHG
ncbi:MAG: hypothetical protein ACK6DC_13220 [Planctomycetota bacterium]